MHLIFICSCDEAQDWNLICVCVMEGNVHWTGFFMIDKNGVLVLHQSRYFVSNCCCDTNMVKFLHLCLLCMTIKYIYLSSSWVNSLFFNSVYFIYYILFYVSWFLFLFLLWFVVPHRKLTAYRRGHIVRTNSALIDTWCWLRQMLILRCTASLVLVCQ